MEFLIFHQLLMGLSIRRGAHPKCKPFSGLLTFHVAGLFPRVTSGSCEEPGVISSLHCTGGTYPHLDWNSRLAQLGPPHPPGSSGGWGVRDGGRPPMSGSFNCSRKVRTSAENEGQGGMQEAAGWNTTSTCNSYLRVCFQIKNASWIVVAFDRYPRLKWLFSSITIHFTIAFWGKILLLSSLSHSWK